MKNLICFLAIVATISVLIIGCEENKKEGLQTYVVLDKNKDIGSHFNLFSSTGFTVETDYMITLRNENTGNVFIYYCRANEYYTYKKGMSFRCARLLGDNSSNQNNNYKWRNSEKNKD